MGRWKVYAQKLLTKAEQQRTEMQQETDGICTLNLRGERREDTDR